MAVSSLASPTTSTSFLLDSSSYSDNRKIAGDFFKFSDYGYGFFLLGGMNLFSELCLVERASKET
jgi:hypothetical protein